MVLGVIHTFVIHTLWLAATRLRNDEIANDCNPPPLVRVRLDHGSLGGAQRLLRTALSGFDGDITLAL